MTRILRARVTAGRFKDQIVRVTNVSLDELGRKKAAVFLPDGSRANISADDLEVIPDEVKEPEIIYPKKSMPFVSGAASSRTMTQTKNMAKPRAEYKSPVTKETLALCEDCGQEYNLEERKGGPGKLTQCENCFLESKGKR